MVYIKRAFTYFIVFALTGGGFPSDIPAVESESSRPNLSQISVPDGYGQISDFFDSGAGKIVVVIEDVHAHTQAQTNIQNLLMFLSKNMGLWAPETLLLEGATGSLDRTPFDGISSEKVRQDLLRVLLQKGEISGSEMFALSDPKNPVPLWGIDDPSLYRQNLAAFENTVQKRGEFLESLERHEIALMSRLDLKEKSFFDLWGQYEDETLSFMDFLQYLLTSAKEASVALPQKNLLKIIVDLQDRMKKTNPQSLQDDMNRLWEMISQQASKEMLSEGVKQALAFRLGKISMKSFAEDLEKWMKELKIPSSTYIVLIQFLQDSRIAQNINWTEAQRDLADFAKEIVCQRAHDKSAMSKKVEEWRSIRSLERLAKLQWTRDEFQERKDTVAKPFSSALAFYQIALQRDQVLIHNSLNFLNERASRCVAVVVGGFHREGFTEYLKREGVSYIVLRPRLTLGMDYKNYENLLMGHLNTPFAQMALSLRMAVPSRLLNQLSDLKDVQKFNLLLALYHKVCSASLGLSTATEAEEIYQKEKARWLEYLAKARSEVGRLDLSPEEIQLRRKGIENLIEMVGAYDLDLSEIVHARGRLYIPLLQDGKVPVMGPVTVEYIPKDESQKPKDLNDLVEILEEETLRTHVVRFVQGPLMEADLAELVAGLLSGRNQDLESLLDSFWEQHILDRLNPTEEQVAYWEKLINEFAKEVFPQKERPIVELISNAITSVWKLEGVVPQQAVAFVHNHGFEVIDHGAGMNLREILFKLIIPGLSGTRGTEGIGQFGVGFYSVLRYLKTSKDRVIVTTNDGKNAHRLEFSLQDKRIRVRILPIPVHGVDQGTGIEVEVPAPGAFDRSLVENTARKAFEYNQRGKIILNGEVINQKVLDFREYQGLQDEMVSKSEFLGRAGFQEALWNTLVKEGYLDDQGKILSRFDGSKANFILAMSSLLGDKVYAVFRFLDRAHAGHVYFSKAMASGAKNLGKGKIIIVKDEVVLFSVDTQGWNIPEEVVIRVPKYIKIPLERDKIEMGPQERKFFQSIIIALSEHSHGIALLSAFYPMAEYLQGWNPSPDKEDDLLRFFFVRVRSLLNQTAAVLPDLKEFTQVNVPKVQYLHPDLFLRFEEHGVRIPVFDSWKEFQPQDSKMKVYFAPFRDINQAIARFSHLVLVSEQWKPSTLLEKAIVYLLMNYYIEREKNIPGTFLDIPAPTTADLAEDFSLDIKANTAAYEPLVLEAQPYTVQSYFHGSRKLLTVTVRFLLESVNARMALSGNGLSLDSVDWKGLSEELSDQLDKILTESAAGIRKISLSPYLVYKSNQGIVLNPKMLRTHLAQALKSLHSEITETQGYMKWPGVSTVTESPDQFGQIEKILVDDQGVLYAFDIEKRKVARIKGNTASTSLLLSVPDRAIVYDLTVNPDGQEYYAAIGPDGVAVLDNTGKEKTRIHTRVLGDRLGMETDIQKIATVGQNTLLLWDSRRRCILAYQRSGQKEPWELTRRVSSSADVVKGLVGDAYGNIFVLEASPIWKEIIGYDPMGNKSFSLRPLDALHNPVDLKVDPQGNLWILDTQKGILKYTADGRYLGLEAKGSAVHLELDSPSGLVLLPKGHFLISSRTTREIHRFKEIESKEPAAPLSKKNANAVLHDLTLMGFLEAFLHEDEGKGQLLPLAVRSLFKDPERWALIQSWMDFRDPQIDFSAKNLTLSSKRYRDFLFQMFIYDLNKMPYHSIISGGAYQWMFELRDALKKTPLTKWFHPEDYRFFMAYYKIRKKLSNPRSQERFHQFFLRTIRDLDADNFFMKIKFYETLSDWVGMWDGQKIFSSDRDFKNFQVWLDKITIPVFADLSGDGIKKLNEQLSSVVQFMLESEGEVGTHQMGELARIFFKGAFSVAKLSSHQILNQKKYLEIWREWVNVPLDELNKDFERLDGKKPISASREHHLYYLTHNDLDLDKIEEVRPLRAFESPILVEKKFSLTRFYAQYLESSEEERDDLLNPNQNLAQLDQLQNPVGNTLSIETAQSLLRNSINEQSVEAYVFIRELIQNSLDASRNALAFMIVDVIQEKGLPLDWTLSDVQDRVDYKIRQWIRHFRKDPEGFIQEISQASLDSSRNAFAFGVIGRILTARLSVDWRDEENNEETVRVVADWISEYEQDPKQMVNQLLTLATDEAMARMIIRKAQVDNKELNVNDPMELTEQLKTLVPLEELQRRFNLAQPPELLRLANAVRRKYMEIELFRGRPDEMVMSFMDAVGMDLEHILKYLLVPGTSSKPARDPHADGRFGIGFLTAFKDASEVEVISSKGGKLVHVRFEPVRDEHDTVVDVITNISIKANPESFRGTRILWKTKTKKFPLLASYLRSTVGEYAGTVSTSEMVIRWQRKMLNEKQVFLARRDIPGLGTLTWYASPTKKNLLVRRGMKVKPLKLETDVLAMIPRKILESRLKQGVVIEIPRRTPLTRSRSDMASKEIYLDVLQQANAAIALELALKSFLDGTNKLDLDMLPYDYLKKMIEERRYEPKDPKILSDAISLRDGKLIDMTAYVPKQGSDQKRFEAGHRLVQLLTVIPLVENPEGGPRLSLLDLINRADLGEGESDELFLDRLPNRLLAQSMKSAFDDERRRRQQEKISAQKLTRPEAAVQNLELPAKIVPGFDSYWAFHAFVLSVSRFLGTASQYTAPVEILYRIRDNSDIAYGGQGYILFNLYNVWRDIEKWGKFIKGKLSDKEAIPLLYETLLSVTHEMAHLLEPPGMGTHHEQFYAINKYTILILLYYRNELQKLVDVVKNAKYKGEFKGIYELEPHLIVSSRGPVTVRKLMKILESDGEAPLQALRNILGTIHDPSHLNKVFQHLAVNAAREGNDEFQFQTVTEALRFLDSNPQVERAMILELRKILTGESGDPQFWFYLSLSVDISSPRAASHQEMLPLLRGFEEVDQAA